MKAYKKKQNKVKLKNKKTGMQKKRPADHKPPRTSHTKRQRTKEEKKLYTGVFCGTRQGYGFLHAEGLSEDVFVPMRAVNGALHGDTVSFRLHSERAEKKTAEIERVEAYGRETLCGILCEEHPQRRIGRTDRRRSRPDRRFCDGRSVRYYVIPDDARFGDEIEVTLPPSPASAAKKSASSHTAEIGAASAADQTAPSHTAPTPHQKSLATAPAAEKTPSSAGIAVGDKVEVRLVRHSEGRPTGEVLQSFGKAGTKSAGYQSILAENGIRTAFPPAVTEEAERSSREALSGKGRTRPHEYILTIDGADAKDLDDAISLTRTPDGGYRLGVHIADVSHYVKEDGAVEKEAYLRGTSVYFTDRVVPMLPEALSNGACSLNAGEDKYAISAYMTLDQNVQLLETRLYPSMIRSAVRGVYSEVNDLFEKGISSPFFEKYKDGYETLLEMRALYRLLEKKASSRGMIDFETPEARILLDADGNPTEIVRRTRGDAEKMIEQFMLTANEGVATLLHRQKLPCVYRVHKDPDPEKLENLLTFAKSLGLPTKDIPKENATPRQLQQLLHAAREKGLEAPLSYVLLRAMQKACYRSDAFGHYGLGISLYCHFTSPIRRLSDLATHRIIRALLFEKPHKNSDKADALSLARYQKTAARAADAATAGELRALAAERSIDALYKALYMSRFVGESFPAVITGMTSFGIFATLPNTCEGMVALAESDDRFLYDEGRHLLVGRSTTYRLGDAVTVEVTDCDMAEHRVYLKLLAKQ